MSYDANFWGAVCFGVVIGWVTYRTLRRSETTGISDIASVIGALGGAAITSLWPQGTGAFAGYCFGVIGGFFGYLIVSLMLVGKGGTEKVYDWLGSDPTYTPAGAPPPTMPTDE